MILIEVGWDLICAGKTTTFKTVILSPPRRPKDLPRCAGTCMLMSGFLATTFRFAFNGVNRKGLVKSRTAALKSRTSREVLRPKEGLRMTVVEVRAINGPQAGPMHSTSSQSAATAPAQPAGAAIQLWNRLLFVR